MTTKPPFPPLTALQRQRLTPPPAYAHSWSLLQPHTDAQPMRANTNQRPALTRALRALRGQRWTPKEYAELLKELRYGLTPAAKAPTQEP